MDNANLQRLPVNLGNIGTIPTTDTIEAIAFPTSNPSAFQSFPVAIGELDQRILNTAGGFRRPLSIGHPHGDLAGSHHMPHHGHSQMTEQRMQQLLESNNEEAQIQLTISTSHGQMEALGNLASSKQSASHGHGGSSHTFAPPDDPLGLLSSPRQGELIQNPGSRPILMDSESALKIHSGGPLNGFRFVPDPPDLQAWRERLFNVDDTITLTEEQ